MARPTLPANGVKPWGDQVRNAVFDVSDRADNAIASATAASSTATSALSTANSAAQTSTSNSTAITALQQTVATKANDNAVVKLTGDQTVGGTKTFTLAPVVPDNSFAISKITGLQTALNNAGSGGGGTGTGDVSSTDPRLSDTRVPTDGSVTNVKVATNANISADKIADGTTNKVFTSALANKLSGIANLATANQTDAYLLSRANHTGGLSADVIVDGVNNRMYTSGDKTKLNGIATSATANQTDSYLLSRVNHTGVQPISSVSGLQTSLDSKLSASALANSHMPYATAVALTTRPAVPSGVSIRVYGGTKDDPFPSWFINGDYRDLYNA